MPEDVDIAVFYRRIGMLTIERDAYRDRISSLETELGKTRTVAGEALRALVCIDRKDISDRILSGEKWHDLVEEVEGEDSAVAAEEAGGGSPGPGPLVEQRQRPDGQGDREEALQPGLSLEAR